MLFLRNFYFGNPDQSRIGFEKNPPNCFTTK
jgi:hypothetical protein